MDAAVLSLRNRLRESNETADQLQKQLKRVEISAQREVTTKHRTLQSSEQALAEKDSEIQRLRHQLALNRTQREQQSALEEQVAAAVRETQTALQDAGMSLCYVKIAFV